MNTHACIITNRDSPKKGRSMQIDGAQGMRQGVQEEQRPRIQKVIFENPAEEQLATTQYWGFFSKDEIARNAGRLLMLDIDFGRDCSLRCPTCFRRSNPVDDSADCDLTFDQLLDVIHEAKKLGLKTVKICGAGEPLENPDLLRLARQLTEWGVGLSIFSKGHVLGDDSIAARVFGHEGVRNASSLASALHELKTSMLLSFQSFNPKIQDRLVGNVKGHTARRNRAAEILAEAGFNKCLPTRLAFCANPITHANYRELFDIYTYCRERNILPVIAALMTSGKQFGHEYLAGIDVTDDQKIDLYCRIYEYNIMNGIQSLNRVFTEGISPLAGIHPCNQIAAGLYVTCNGNVISCPGDSECILGNIRRESIRDIWNQSDNYRRRGTFNCKCPPKDGKTIPYDLYSMVLNKLVGKFGPDELMKKRQNDAQ